MSDLSDLKEDIWKKEESYWSSIKSGDLKTYSTFLHPDFTDWPAFTEEPVLGVDKMVEVVSQTNQNFKKFSFQLEHKLTQVGRNDMVIVYFIAEIEVELNDKSTIRSTNRMIHIWKKYRKEWKLIGGLQYPRE